MSLPIFNLVRGFPTDLRELLDFFKDINLNVRKSRNRVHAASQRFLNQIAVGGKRSTQSVNPLSSTDSGGGFAEIAIAAHELNIGEDEPVAYGSGTITGLLNSTLYYVYTDDPELEGGAVTYLSTTNHTIATSNRGRYYVGKITTDAAAGGGTSGGWGGGGGGGGNPLP